MPSRDRQRALARAKLERQMARRAESARRRRQIQAATGAVLAILLVVGGAWWAVSSIKDDDPANTASPQASAAPSPAASLAPGECAYPKAEEKGKDVGTPPTKDVVHAGTRPATIALSSGDVEVELDAAKAPCTVNSLAFLAAKKYFDATICHRLVTDGIFVLQCGDPTGSGSGGPGYKFGEENVPADADANYPAGSLAMANAGPGTNGSQFFIVYKDTKLPPNYTIFGKVTKGLDVVQKIADTGIESGKPGDGKPKNEVKIKTVTVAAAKG